MEHFFLCLQPNSGVAVKTAALIFYSGGRKKMLQETLLKVVATINSYLSDYILIFLLVGVGLF